MGSSRVAGRLASAITRKSGCSAHTSPPSARAAADEGVTKLATATEAGIETGDHTLHGLGSGRPYTGGSYDVSGGTLAFVGGDPAWPGELFVERSGQLAQVTDVNGDVRRTMELAGVSEQWRTADVDGQRSQSWIITPPGFEVGALDEDGQPVQYPMMLEIHGGPFAAYGPHVSYELQLFASLADETDHLVQALQGPR